MKEERIWLGRFRKEISRPKCNPGFQSVHCIAHLEEDISEILPYLNAELGGYSYLSDPPKLTLKTHGRLITLHSDRIAINALEDEQEADRVLAWLRREMNECWARRDEITPLTTGPKRPQLIEILRLLPKTNCQECGQVTCMVFANLVADGAKSAKDCPPLQPEKAEQLKAYMEAHQSIG